MKPYRFTLTVACLLAGLGMIGGCSGKTAKEERQYAIQGTVLDVSGGQLKIDHAAIPGYMGAMQMSFPVSKPELLQGLKAGDHVHGQLKVSDGQPVITELTKD